MTHPNTPVYYTVSTIDQFDGTTTVLAICEDMDAVMYRLKQCYTTCGDEYVINAYHLTTASDAATKYNEQLVSRREYEAKEKEKEDKLKELEDIKAKEEEYNKEDKNNPTFHMDEAFDAASYT
ncbi:hypothetical protein CYIG_00036 [Cyanophage NATL1A-7]|uniref:Predicted protein n=1 Tax=Cyanophage NATL1A-7 TaxID=445693 RepID=E3SNA5_9CAUD|nr:hypothetical protein CYIG_00036 [Cyanophage NATL1A-7]ADP00109.1 predicted protein [Cyanophage NATL1A-7]